MRPHAGSRAFVVVVALEASAPLRVAGGFVPRAISVLEAAELAAPARRIARRLDGTVEVETALDAAVCGRVATRQSPFGTLGVREAFDAGAPRRVTVKRSEPAVGILETAWAPARSAAAGGTAVATRGRVGEVEIEALVATGREREHAQRANDSKWNPKAVLAPFHGEPVSRRSASARANPEG